MSTRVKKGAVAEGEVGVRGTDSPKMELKKEEGIEREGFGDGMANFVNRKFFFLLL